jgi:predicted metal-dependent phosphotriesterase family hydrolase
MDDRPQGEVQTVLGRVAADLLGPTDAHEHLFLDTPALPGEAFTELEPMVAEASALRAAGARAVADLTPIGCGRDPRALRLLAERTGLHVIAATGFHRDAHYPAAHWVHAEPEDVLAELLVTDLTEGMDERDWQGPLPRRSAARAGVVKLGASYQRLSPSERRRLGAGAEAAVRTGAPVAVHCETGTYAHEILDLLAEHDLPARRVALAHLDRNPDPGLHAELAERGAFVMYDGAGKVKHHPDSLLIDLVAWMAEAGHAASVLLGGDVGRRGELRAHGGGPGIAHLFAVLVPRLRKALGAELVAQVTIDNPARAFAFDAPAGPRPDPSEAAARGPDPSELEA